MPANYDLPNLGCIIAASAGCYLIYVGGADSGLLETYDSPTMLPVKYGEYTLYEFTDFLAKPAPPLIAASTHDRELTENLLAWAVGNIQLRPNGFLGLSRERLEALYTLEYKRFGRIKHRNKFPLVALREYSRLIQSLR